LSLVDVGSGVSSGVGITSSALPAIALASLDAPVDF